MKTHSLCDQFQVTREEIQTRRSFLEFTDEDEENLILIRNVIQPDADLIVEEFYAHLLRFAEVEGPLSDKATLEQLKSAQRRHLLSLGQGSDTAEYFEERLRTGITHEQVGLKQKWYLGAQSKLFALIASRIGNRYGKEPEILKGLLVTLKKTLTLDSVLAAETYYEAAIQRLEEALSQLTTTQQKLQDASRLDGLTNVNNRVSLMESLEMERNRSRRFSHPLTLLFLDLDYFKNINDSFGHTFGDFVLRRFVELMLSETRTSDVIGRYGGEEFVIGLVECQEDVAVTIAERIRKKVARTPFELQERKASVAVSVGVATLVPEIETVEKLIDRADQAMYEAKQTGRNRVCVYH